MEYERARDNAAAHGASVTEHIQVIADANTQAYLADAAAIQTAAEASGFADDWGADFNVLNGQGRA
ncbi:MAG TPA: hypothetical protein VHG10_14680 [Glycomyces sp.]|nr:hypothetical protein [Glycomyces sp.]